MVANLTVQIFLSQTAINILMGKNTKCAHPGNDHHKNICKRIQSSTMWSFDDSIHLEQGWWAGIKIRLAGPVCSHHRGCHREAHRCRACRSPSLRSTQQSNDWLVERPIRHTSVGTCVISFQSSNGKLMDWWRYAGPGWKRRRCSIEAHKLLFEMKNLEGQQRDTEGSQGITDRGHAVRSIRV